MRTHFALVKANTVDTIPIEVSANDRDTMIHQSNRERMSVYAMGEEDLNGASGATTCWSLVETSVIGNRREARTRREREESR